MTRQVIFLTIHTIGLIVDTTHNGEKDGRMAIPILRISLPQVFLTMSILDALKFCSLLRYNDGELFVFQFYHLRLLFFSKDTNYSPITKELMPNLNNYYEQK